MNLNDNELSPYSNRPGRRVARFTQYLNYCKQRGSICIKNYLAKTGMIDWMPAKKWSQTPQNLMIFDISRTNERYCCLKFRKVEDIAKLYVSYALPREKTKYGKIIPVVFMIFDKSSKDPRYPLNPDTMELSSLVA